MQRSHVSSSSDHACPHATEPNETGNRVIAATHYGVSTLLVTRNIISDWDGDLHVKEWWLT